MALAWPAIVLCGIAPAIAAAEPISGRPVLITGEVQAENAEGIYTPESNISPVVLRYYVPDGTQVQPGDVLVRVDPGGSAAQVRALQAQIEQGQARAAKELVELQVKAIDAERVLVDAQATHRKAEIDAAIPRQHLSGLDFDRYQGELERATRELALKRDEHAAAGTAVQRRRDDAELEVRKLQADRLYHEAQVKNSEQRAESAGTVLHGFDNWRGTRFDEGSSANNGQRIGEVVGAGGMRIRAYVLEPDRVGLREGQQAQLSFDALPEANLRGRIERIAGAPEAKAEWGDGRYFSLDLALLDPGELPLRPGMNVRVAIDPAQAAPASVPGATP
jgi:multidrug resistance efflux pump